MRTPTLTSLLLIASVAALPLGGCSDYSKDTNQAEREHSIDEQAQDTIRAFKSADPSLDRFFSSSVGYAVFPEVTKGGAGIGAAHGYGVVYHHGSIIGDTELSQGSIGLQLGGQSYREIVFFENQAALDHYKNGNTEFAANASAVAASAGAAASADYHDGVAVFAITRGGLMFEATIGGQKFSYKPR